MTRKVGRSARVGNRPTSGECSSYVQGYTTEANYDIIEELVAWAQERERRLNEMAEA